MIRAAVLALAACAPPVAPAPLSSTAPVTHEPILLYFMTSSATRANELHWIDARGTTGGPVAIGDFLGIDDLGATPRGTWLRGTTGIGEELLLARRTGDGVIVQRFATVSTRGVSADGTRAYIACADGWPCVAPIGESRLGEGTPVPKWDGDYNFVAWHGGELLFAKDGHQLIWVDPESGAQRAAGTLPDTETILATDPTGTAALSFETGARAPAYVTRLDRPQRRFRAEPEPPSFAFMKCELPETQVAVCAEIREAGGNYTYPLAIVTAGGRRELTLDSQYAFAAMPGHVAFFDRPAQELVVTNLRGEQRRILVRVPAGSWVTPFAWIP